jgi:hypothetical protein
MEHTTQQPDVTIQPPLPNIGHVTNKIADSGGRTV